ncbi:unnamed protein product [Mortierella alpina]
MNKRRGVGMIDMAKRTQGFFCFFFLFLYRAFLAPSPTNFLLLDRVPLFSPTLSILMWRANCPRGPSLGTIRRLALIPSNQTSPSSHRHRNKKKLCSCRISFSSFLFFVHAFPSSAPQFAALPPPALDHFRSFLKHYLSTMSGLRDRVKNSGVWKEFTDFIGHDNVINLGVGLVIGGAFSKVLSSFVDDILTPPLGLVIAGSNLENWFIVIRPGKHDTKYETIEEAQQDGAVTQNVGRFLMTAINFLLVAVTLFVIIFTINRVRKFRKAYKEKKRNGGVIVKETEPETQDCNWCNAKVPFRAVKCMYCTSYLHEKVPADLLNKQPSLIEFI